MGVDDPRAGNYCHEVNVCEVMLNHANQRFNSDRRICILAQKSTTSNIACHGKLISSLKDQPQSL